MEYLNDLEGWKSELVETVHFLHKQGWTPATSSNFSFRFPGKAAYFISRTGVDRGLFNEKHLILVDQHGSPVYNLEEKPPVETRFHTLLYENTQTGAVLHTHSVNATVLSLYYQQDAKIILSGFEMLKAINGVESHDYDIVIPIFNNSHDLAALSEEIRVYYRSHPDMKAFLLAGHGLYTWGETIMVAKRHIEAIEYMLECRYRLLLLRK